MKQIILAEFESVFLPFKDDKDKLTNLEEMCRVLIALDMLGAHIIVYTAGDKNEVLQFFSYFAPSILSQSDVLKIDSEPDSKPFIILSAINYHNQVSPVDEHITDCFEEQVIVLDGDPDFINQLTAAHAHIRVKAYLVDNDNFTHRRMLESLFNSIYLNTTQSAVAARARRNREEAILDNDQKLLRLGYAKSMNSLSGDINGSLMAIMRDLFYYLLLRRRLTAANSPPSDSALQNISEFFLQLDDTERDKLIADTDHRLDEEKIPTSQDLINYLALQYRCKYLEARDAFQLPAVEEFLQLSVNARNTLIEKAEHVLSQNELPTQQQVFHYLTLLNCCMERNIKSDSPPLEKFLALKSKLRDEIVARLNQKLQHVEGLSKYKLSGLLACALHEPLTAYLLQYIPLETLKDLYCARFSEIKDKILAAQKEFLLIAPVTQLKVGDDEFKVLVIQSHTKAKINEKALNEVLSAYEKLICQTLENEKRFLQETTLSFLQLWSKYTAQTDEALGKEKDLDVQIVECKEELDKKRAEISREFEEAVRPKEQENLRGTIIGRRQAIDSEDTQNGKVLNACRVGNLDALKVAIAEMGASFDIHHAYSANNNRTLLDIACLHAYVEMVRYLLTIGADVNCQISGAPPLVYALRGLHHYPSRIEIIRLLLEKGAKLNFTTTDNSGNTPLHIAAQQGNVRGVELLAQWVVVQKPQEGFSINSINREHSRLY